MKGRGVMGANLPPVHSLTGVMSSLEGEAFRVQEGVLGGHHVPGSLCE